MFWLFSYLFYIAGGGAALAAGLVSYLALLQPDFHFPQLTGQHAVGTVTYHWIDEARKEPTSKDPAHPYKELMVQVWYPAEDKLAQVSTVPYDPYFVDYCKENQKIIWLLLFARQNYSYALPEVPLLEGEQSFPVILCSPGLSATRTGYTAYCEELASHGFVVVGISHTIYGGFVQFPDGRSRMSTIDQESANKRFFEDPMAELKDLGQGIDVWVKDVQVVLGRLEQLTADQTSPFYNRLDTDKIGMFGHSYGGAATIQLCRRDSRIKAGVNMDGGLLGADATQRFDKPVMFLLATPMSEIEMQKKIDKIGLQADKAKEYGHATYQCYLPAINTLAQAIGHDVYSVALNGAEHAAFCDMALIKEGCLLSRPLQNLGVGPINGYRATEIVNAYLVGFFDKYLKNRPSELLDGGIKRYPEVEARCWNNTVQ